MKKNITINLCGRLFHIDEDAYELLNNYIDTLRNYFSRQDGGEEIADDLEERIAELLDEVKEQGFEAITIDHVKQVISRVGQPEQMDETASADSFEGRGATSDDGEGTHGNTEQTKASQDENGRKRSFDDFADDVKNFFNEHRFYRNPKDKMIAGVMSGLATSFEVDVTLLRLLLVAIAILLGAIPFPYVHGLHMSSLMFLVLIYAILAFIMPVAETPEQQLKMQGKPVNMQNLAEEVVQNVEEPGNQEGMKQKSLLNRVLNGCLRFIVGCIKVLLVLLAITLFFAGVIALLYAIFALCQPDFVEYYFRWRLEPILDPHRNLFIGFFVSFVATLIIPAYAIVQHLIRPLKIWQRLLLFFVWLSCLATTVVVGNLLDTVSSQYLQRQRAEVIHHNSWDMNDLITE